MKNLPYQFYVWIWDIVGSENDEDYDYSNRNAEYGVSWVEWFSMNSSYCEEKAQIWFSKQSVEEQNRFIENYKKHLQYTIDEATSLLKQFAD
jgi:hypothetical protein